MTGRVSGGWSYIVFSDTLLWSCRTPPCVPARCPARGVPVLRPAPGPASGRMRPCRARGPVRPPGARPVVWIEVIVTDVAFQMSRWRHPGCGPPRGIGDHGPVMFAFAAVMFPLLLLGLLLAMERVERPLNAADAGKGLEGFLNNARPDEVDTFVNQGLAAALERYRKRLRRSPPGRHRAV